MPALAICPQTATRHCLVTYRCFLISTNMHGGVHAHAYACVREYACMCPCIRRSRGMGVGIRIEIGAGIGIGISLSLSLSLSLHTCTYVYMYLHIPIYTYSDTYTPTCAYAVIDGACLFQVHQSLKLHIRSHTPKSRTDRLEGWDTATPF